MVLVATQLALFSQLGTESTFWRMLPALVVGGIGMALVMTPSAAAAMRGVAIDKAGVGSAVLNSARQVGGSIGIALMGAIMAHEIASARGAGKGPEDAFVQGFEVSLLVAAGIALGGAVVAAGLVRTHRRPDADAAPAVEATA